jgi:hypothetical protein
MAEIVFLVEEAREGGLTACALGELIFTRVEAPDELRRQVRNGVRCNFALGQGPAAKRLHDVRDEVFAA